MWTYSQLTGRLRNGADQLFGVGYSGSGIFKNVPSAENRIDQGPIPIGRYSIQPPVDTVTHGPYVLPLIPYPDNVMYGRAGFLMHGDSVVHPGTASEGCIVMPRLVRQQVWDSGDHDLQVVSGLVTVDSEISV